MSGCVNDLSKIPGCNGKTALVGYAKCGCAVAFDLSTDTEARREMRGYRIEEMPIAEAQGLCRQGKDHSHGCPVKLNKAKAAQGIERLKALLEASLVSLDEFDPGCELAQAIREELEAGK